MIEATFWLTLGCRKDGHFAIKYMYVFVTDPQHKLDL